jgi:oligosaccharide amylase
MITQLTGNGRVLVTIDETGEWAGLFYPYPGQFQHLRETRLGLFEVGERKFHWLRDQGAFHLSSEFPPPGHAPRSIWSHDGLSISVEDFIHPNHDLIIRVVKFRSDRPRELRLFSYQSLNIAESLYQETAYCDPDYQSVVHYKRSFYFEFYGIPTFNRAVCGEHTLKGLKGTYVDAEDGVLDGRDISHGAADSVMQFDVTVRPGEERVVRIFVGMGDSPEGIHQLHQYVWEGDPTRFEREAQAFWRTWVARHPPKLSQGLSERGRQLYKSSVLNLRHSCGSNGSIIASPDTRSLAVGGDTYNYCWWRDGGYVSKAMDEAGLYDQAERFLEFASRYQRPDGSFVHRHFPDGTIGSTWHPPPFLQIDQTGTVIAAVWHHFKRRTDLDSLLTFWPMVKQAANFLVDFRDPATGLPKESFDLWEERKSVATYSVAVVGHGLERAARIALELGKDPARWREASDAVYAAALKHLWNDEHQRFLRSVHPTDTRLDASLLLALKLGLLAWDDPRARHVVDGIEQRLWSPKVGGVARFEEDSYYGRENPWILCTLWLAEARLNLGEPDRCRELIEWVVAHATPSLLLPEQIDAVTGEPKSAVPLTWSHSTFVDVVHKYHRALSGGETTDE